MYSDEYKKKSIRNSIVIIVPKKKEEERKKVSSHFSSVDGINPTYIANHINHAHLTEMFSQFN